MGDRSPLTLPAGLRARLRTLWNRLRGGELSRKRAALSVAVGLFIGCLPLYGLHFVLCLTVCLPLRLDLLVAYLAANISNPLVAPFLIALEIETGSWLLTGRSVPFDVEQARKTGVLGFFAEALLGSIVVGSAFAGLGAFVTALLVRNSSRQSQVDLAISRTVARYREVPIGDRIYVAIKLKTDPITYQLAALDEELGRVLDVGSGRGQFGLLLQELGRLSSLAGSDWDARKVAVANQAARGSASFTVLDITDQNHSAADTILLIDVLHYLPPAEQDALLAQLVGRLAPGGRILIRELDAQPTWRSRWTRLFERIAARLAYNRAASLHFRPARELLEALRRLGLECSVSSADPGSLLANVLITARLDGRATSSCGAPSAEATSG